MEFIADILVMINCVISKKIRSIVWNMELYQFLIRQLMYELIQSSS